MIDLPTGYTPCDQTPSVETYLRLRRIAGLSPKTGAGAEIGLPRTLIAVQILQDDQPVGMGRVVGDGALFVQVVDIAVDPAHQGRGLGKAIMARLMERMRTELPSGTYVSLLADGEAHRLYAQYGFTLTAPASVGMALKLP
ncbi:GNAT family N-acetyltransferase [Brevundimonas sp.]|uniref:GNAT family N-acetyltransferase n=1 Tax=Brevundimonas sp. TaxID=1871086 RepID=UPI003AF788FF